MQDQKNLILAIVLSVAILAGFQYFFEAPRLERQAAEREAAESLSQVETPGAEVPGGRVPVAAPDAVVTPGDIVRARDQLIDRDARVRIESPRLNGSIALQGGRIDDLTLATYRQTTDPESTEIVLLSPKGTANPYYAEFGWIAPGGGDVALPTSATVWQATNKLLSPDQPVRLTWDNGAGLRFIQTYALDRNYMFTVTQRIENKTFSPVELQPYGLISRHNTPEIWGYFILHEGPIGVFNDTLEEPDYDDLQEAPRGRIQQLPTTGGWIGITDKFWLTALVPDQGSPFTGSFNHWPAKTSTDPQDTYQVDYLRAAASVPAGGAFEVTNRLFAGAKEVRVLDGYHTELGITRFDLAIDWGWFPFLTKPLFHAIDYFHRQLGNFGLAIIAITIIIKFLFLPLAYKSYVSMSRMKLLQPKMVEMRERIGDDRQKLNQEMMELYKREKVNPVSGCLPVLLQIPVFFALYKVLFVTIEMRHQPFYGWIHDLSAPDPTNIFNLFGLIPLTPPDFLSIGIWPLLMGASMFFQQRLNPQPTDPVQAKIFQWMPLFFMFLLARFPAGLVLYWTCNNVLSIAQQWFIMKRTKKPGGQAASKPAQPRRSAIERCSALFAQAYDFFKRTPKRTPSDRPTMGQAPQSERSADRQGADDRVDDGADQGADQRAADGTDDTADEGTDDGADDAAAAIERGRVLFAQSCDFVTGAAQLDQLPEAGLPEVAFAGRSNVGKSSLINALTGRNRLARTSVTPGRTRQINFFELGGALHLADLPGYGYAQAPKTEIAAWTRLVRGYLKGRPDVVRAFLLIDSRHGLEDSDRDLMAMLDTAAVNYQVVLTKVDKIKPEALEARTAAIAAEIRGHAAAFPALIATSATKGTGIADLRAEIATLASR